MKSTQFFYNIVQVGKITSNVIAGVTLSLYTNTFPARSYTVAFMQYSKNALFPYFVN